MVEQRRLSGAALLDLTISNPTQAIADYPHEQIRNAYSEVTHFRYEPNPFGSVHARKLIAQEYAARGIAISPQQIALTASTSEAYALLFKLFCDPGDSVLVPVPSYPLFDYLAKLECVKAIPYRLLYDGDWYIDFAHVREQITMKTKAIVVVNPNNPTGSFLKTSDQQQVKKLARERNIPIISDEVFTDYSIIEEPDTARTMIGCDEVLSFSLNGLSKMAAMPQVKLSWMAINGPANVVTAAQERLELVLDTYLSLNTPTQSALKGLLCAGDKLREQLLVRIRENHSFLQEELSSTPIHLLRNEGGWSAILQLPLILPEEAWIERFLIERDVIVQPGYFFDMPSEAYIVISLITAPDVLAEGVRRICSVLE